MIQRNIQYLVRVTEASVNRLQMTSLRSIVRFNSTSAVSQAEKDVEITEEEKAKSFQAPNRKETWAASQRSRDDAFSGPRFAQINLAAQPKPYAAINLIAEQPVRFVESNIAVCDGGRGAQGHPKVFINLDQDGPNTCTYCGLQFQQSHHH
ncbi:zinc-finger domain-containing protein [Lipomyces japonicus]|uniref:zinc-finger domain-containing protein n=1 Tax=Lipomyces japonicus TaxID=56871 RepID=UPI0034CFC1A8